MNTAQVNAQLLLQSQRPNRATGTAAVIVSWGAGFSLLGKFSRPLSCRHDLAWVYKRQVWGLWYARSCLQDRRHENLPIKRNPAPHDAISAAGGVHSVLPSTDMQITDEAKEGQPRD